MRHEKLIDGVGLVVHRQILFDDLAEGVHVALTLAPL